MQLTDDYNRSIIFKKTKKEDIYFVDDGNGNTFNLSYPPDTEWERVLSTINSMAPPLTTQTGE